MGYRDALLWSPSGLILWLCVPKPRKYSWTQKSAQLPATQREGFREDAWLIVFRPELRIHAYQEESKKSGLPASPKLIFLLINCMFHIRHYIWKKKKRLGTNNNSELFKTFCFLKTCANVNLSIYYCLSLFLQICHPYEAESIYRLETKPSPFSSSQRLRNS